jgi:putative hydrolase of the HAD superfamily
MKAVIFDLDDTLYPEITFVMSGFRSVASLLSEQGYGRVDDIFKLLCEILDKDGRGQIFDQVLTVLQPDGSVTQEQIMALVYQYRTHQPDIKLPTSTIQTLQTLKEQGTSIGIITDGMGSVQRRKIDSLNIDSLVDAVICTDELGSQHWKPSTLPYQIILNRLDTRPHDALFVGDNPAKDFLGANSLGITTFLTTEFITRSVKVPSNTFLPDHTISSLNHILQQVK